MATSKLPPSPTPLNVAQAHAERLQALAEVAAGKDGRLGPSEAKSDPALLDAYTRHGAQRPVLSSVVKAGARAMLLEAQAVHGGDGRVSSKDAEGMSPAYAAAFGALRHPAADAFDAGAAAEALGKAARGLIYMSEGDDPYAGFSLKLPEGTKLDAATLKALLPWPEVPGRNAEPEDYPAQFELRVSPADDFFSSRAQWAREEGDGARAAQLAKVERMLKRDTEGASLDGGAHEAQLWMVTPTERSASRAPLYVVGRTADDQLLGVATWRTWT